MPRWNLSHPLPAQPFPAEITDYIIDYLWGDKCTLKACSLTCQAWLPATRYHLFKSIRIRSSDDCYRFYKLLSTRSLLRSVDFAKYVREITFQDMPFRGLSMGKIANAFRKLRRVDCLKLSYWVYEDRPEDIVTGLGIAFPNIKDLGLVCVEWRNKDELLRLLHSFPHLSSLTVTDDTNRFPALMAEAPWASSAGPAQHEAKNQYSVQEAERTVQITKLTLSNAFFAGWFLEALRRPPFHLRIEQLFLEWTWPHPPIERMMEIPPECFESSMKTLSLSIETQHPEQFGKLTLTPHNPCQNISISSLELFARGIRRLCVSELEALQIGRIVMMPETFPVHKQLWWICTLLDHVQKHAKRLRFVRFQLLVLQNIKELYRFRLDFLDHVLQLLVKERPQLVITFDVILLDARKLTEQCQTDLVSAVIHRLPQLKAACTKNPLPRYQWFPDYPELAASVYFNVDPQNNTRTQIHFM